MFPQRSKEALYKCPATLHYNIVDINEETNRDPQDQYATVKCPPYLSSFPVLPLPTSLRLQDNLEKRRTLLAVNDKSQRKIENFCLETADEVNR